MGRIEYVNRGQATPMLHPRGALLLTPDGDGLAIAGTPAEVIADLRRMADHLENQLQDSTN